MDAVVLFPVTAPNNGEDDDNDDGVEDDNDDVIVAFLPPLGGYLPVLVLVLLLLRVPTLLRLRQVDGGVIVRGVVRRFVPIVDLSGLDNFW